jgi:hypothetical protein
MATGARSFTPDSIAADILGPDKTLKSAVYTTSLNVKNNRESMQSMQDFGHHLSMVYGDCTEQVRDLGVLTDFEVLKVS